MTSIKVPLSSIHTVRKVSWPASQKMNPDMSFEDWKTQVNRSYQNVCFPAIFSDLMIDAERLCEDFYDAAPRMKPKDVANIMNPANKIDNMYIVGNKYLCFRDSRRRAYDDQPLTYYNLTCKRVDWDDIEAAILFLGMLMITNRMSAREIKTWAMTHYVASSNGLGHNEDEFESDTFYGIISLLPEADKADMA